MRNRDEDQSITSIIPKKAIGFGVASLILISTVWGSFYQVSSGEAAYIRRLGQADMHAPIMPGAHFKFPFIDSVDRVSLTQKTVHIEPFIVNTVDNQRVDVKVNVTYVTPPNAVYHLLYEVGRVGDADITENVAPIVRDRASRIFSSKNTNNISLDREKIQAEIQDSVHNSLNSLFMVNVQSLQIEAITYSKAFNDSNDNAVLAKNKAVQEQNNKLVVEYQAAQKVLSAEGNAREVIAAAEGANKSAVLAAQAHNQSVILQAEANAKQIELEAAANAKAIVLMADAKRQEAEALGRGNASAMTAMVQAVGGPDKFIAKLQAEAQKNWNGSVPSIITSDKTGTMMPIIMNQPK